ncbi:MAG TPA: sigma-70 family RNA polymerase sigma factor [Usitatibacter sp.]
MQRETTAERAPEAELARRIAAAAPAIDREAEAALYRLLAPRVRLYGRRHLRDEEEARDLMQHVMVATLEKLRAGELREPARIASFVFGMCRMMTMDMRRGARRREELLEMYAGDLEIADIAVAPRLDEARVAACLERLAERERSVLVLSFYEDEPADRVGAALGLSAGNVRVVRHRAIEKLRECVMGGGKP